MRGGRLKIVNESRYADDEVERLVRFGLSEIDLTGERLVAVVKNVKRSRHRQIAYSGTQWNLRDGIPRAMYDRYCGTRTTTHHLIVMRLGPPESFPTTEFRRYAGVKKDTFRSWQEALVAITAHEGKHAEHDHDGAYRTKSGRRMVKIPSRTLHDNVRTAERYKVVPVRVGVERIEPKCEAFEAYMLRRFRAEVPGAAITPHPASLLVRI